MNIHITENKLKNRIKSQKQKPSTTEITKPNQQTEKAIKLLKSNLFLYIIYFSLLFSATKHILNPMQLNLLVQTHYFQDLRNKFN